MKKCKVCKSSFLPSRPLQSCCGFECAIQHGKKTTEKNAAKKALVERKTRLESLAKLKTRRDYQREAQTAFNGWIRCRDAHKPCVSCGGHLNSGGVGGGFDCGHYRTVGSAPHLRYDERNGNGQCKRCNLWRGGNYADYRIGLIDRIGLAEVEALEADQTAKNYTIDDLKNICAKYKKMKKEVQGGR